MCSRDVGLLEETMSMNGAYFLKHSSICIQGKTICMVMFVFLDSCIVSFQIFCFHIVSISGQKVVLCFQFDFWAILSFDKKMNKFCIMSEL